MNSDDTLLSETDSNSYKDPGSVQTFHETNKLGSPFEVALVILLLPSRCAILYVLCCSFVVRKGTGCCGTRRRRRPDGAFFHDSREIRFKMDGTPLQTDADVELVFEPDPELRPTVTFPLFSLPTEIWLHICSLAITSPSPVDITRARHLADQCRLVAQPPLTRVCRALRKELLPVFYQQNEFEARHLVQVACIRNWFPAIGIDNCLAMGTFTFYAKFEAEFWEQKFRETGIEVKIEIADGNVAMDDGSGLRDRPLQRLVIRFLRAVENGKHALTEAWEPGTIMCS